MILWKITPVADADDPRWLDQPMWSEVVVRAETAGEALMLAGHMQRAAVDDIRPIGNETLRFASGFSDEKLYHIRRLDRDDDNAHKADGPAEVVHAVKSGAKKSSGGINRPRSGLVSSAPSGPGLS